MLMKLTIDVLSYAFSYELDNLPEKTVSNYFFQKRSLQEMTSIHHLFTTNSKK